MKLTGSYKIKSDKRSVWNALNDPNILKESIPGCEEFKKNAENDFSAIATNKIGPFNATFEGNIELKDLNPPDSYKIVGQGNSPVGFASGEAKVTLTENNGVTTLTYAVEAHVGGKIAQVGSRLIDMTAKKMADIFFGNFSKKLSPVEAKEVLDEKPYVKEANEKQLKINIFNKNYIYLTIILVILFLIYLIK